MIFLILTFVANFSWASDSPKVQDWKVGMVYLHTIEDPKSGWILSSQCHKCMALEGAKSASLKGIKKEAKQGGKNPGSLVCSTFKDTGIFLALDPFGNQMTFCRFPDQSFISNDSLFRAAQSNDR